MKEYDLYLDESGDFDRNLADSNCPECLVGGFLCEKGNNFFTDDGIKNFLCSVWRDNCSDFLDETDDAVFSKINHITDVKKTENLRECVPLVTFRTLQSVTANGGILSIFTNKDKSKIKDSAITYLNIACEGICNTLVRLIESNDNSVRLNVYIGLRWDETLKRHIAKKNYTERISEKFELFKAKSSNGKIKGSSFTLNMVNDKKGIPVLSDYICNYYFTNNGNWLYDEYRSKINALFQPAFVFSLESLTDWERINKYYSENRLDSVLLELCYSDKSDDTQINKFVNQDIGNMQFAFDQLNPHFRYIITILRRRNLSSKVLKNAFYIAKKLSESKNDDKYKDALLRIQFDLWMHKETFDSHYGIWKESEEDLKKAWSALTQMTLCYENIGNCFIYYNRCALQHSYMYDFEKAERLCNEYEDKMNQISLFSLSTIFDRQVNQEDIKNEELAKMYGTHVQIATNLLNCGKASLEDVEKLSDKAISLFSSEIDKQRQYQYRAELYRSVGDIEKALHYIAKSCEKNDWHDLKDLEGLPSFILYHLSFICLEALKWQHGLAQDIFNLIKDKKKGSLIPKGNINGDIFSIMPNGMIEVNYFLSDCILNGTTDGVDTIVKILDYMFEVKNTFTLQLYGELYLAMKKNGSPQSGDYKEKFMSQYKKWLDLDLPEGTRAFFAGYYEKITSGEKDALEQFIRTRLY